MSLKPSILTPGNFLFYSVSQYGMTFTQETPRGEWLDAIKRLMGLHEGAVMTRERTLMLLADALNFGEEAFGEEFSQAIDGAREMLGLSPKTIQNAMSTYKRIPASLRRESLTLSHYKEISPLEPDAQEKFIARAINENLTVATLKEEIAEAFPKTKRGKTRKASGDTAVTALKKLIEASDWLWSAALDEIDPRFKVPMAMIYKVFRRKWQAGRKK